MDIQKKNKCRQIALINPAGRGGRNGREINNLLTILKEHTVTQFVSAYPGHMSELAAKSHDFERIISIGGDGTINEILEGMDRNRQQLFIVPAGTGNSLANDFGFKSINHSFNKLKNDTYSISCIDLLSVTFSNSDGSCKECLAASLVSLGYTSRVADTANRKLKYLGKLCYPVAAMIHAGRRHMFPAVITYDNSYRKDFRSTGLLIGNSRFSGDFEAFPRACLHDGVFHVLELSSGFIGQNIYNISVATRTHFYTPVVAGNARKLHITLEIPQLLMIDGDIVSVNATELTVSVIQKGVQCCI